MSFRSVRALVAGTLLCAACASGCAGPTPEATTPGAAPTSAKAGERAREPSGSDSEGSMFLSAIPARVSERARALAAESTSDEAFARALRVRIEIMEGYKDLGELSRRTKIPLVNGTFQISDLSRLGTRDTPTKRDAKSSFVIDYDQMSFAAPAAELERSGKSNSAAGIAAFAGRYISEKTYAHSFDVASRVAQKRAGDCTEHAVFTTALLRRFGFKARVVLGIVLVGVSGKSVQPQVLVFGHAWVELHEKGGWRIVNTALGQADAAGEAEVPAARELPAGVNVRLAYLPLNLMKDETQSFGRALMDQTGVETVLGLDVDVSDLAR